MKEKDNEKSIEEERERERERERKWVVERLRQKVALAKSPPTERN